MPTASPELRAIWHDHPDGGDFAAQAFLRERGFKLTRGWQWIKPTPNHQITQEEMNAIDYLVYEWDFDGVVIP